MKFLLQKFKHFLTAKENNILLINKVNEDIGCFYELALEEIAIRSNVKLDKNTEIFFKEGYIYELLQLLIEINPELNDILLDKQKKLRKFVKIFINGKDIRFIDNEKSFVQDKDQVTIITAVAGG